MKTLIKICGIRRLDDLECAIEHGADFIGFVFVKSSPRYIDAKSVASLVRSIPDKIKTVAVMQHATQSSLDSILKDFRPSYIQTDADDFASLNLPTNIKRWPLSRYAQWLCSRCASVAARHDCEHAAPQRTA